MFNWLFRSPLKENGRYFEIGALDGVTLSNTYALQRCLGWSGLLIEACQTYQIGVMEIPSVT